VLAVTETAAANQREVLRIVRKLSQAGVSSAAEERQQENVVASTEAALPVLKRQIAEIETALSVLVGRAPGSLRFETPATLSLPAELPAGLPSALLERRPDLVQARARLEAANARVNEARARFYPDISLTGVFGRVSTTLSDVLTGGASTVASLGPSVLLPLYSGGALQGNEDAALARLDQAVIGYRKTVLVALGEVSDSLIAYETSAELIAAQERRVVSSRESLRLADMRFRSGVIGFVEVLDAQRQVLAAETDAATSVLERRLALGRVYLALGGGWDANAVVVPERRAASTTP
jgi:multidrug efflux system outer membrane protein